MGGRKSIGHARKGNWKIARGLDRREVFIFAQELIVGSD